ncbi:MAG: hypothetical protein LBQ65_03020 [Tannerellaceae bacterium]|jgi:hypothetical protein|nr:hypothetical protein [Tannerellaceae bacterium]
MKTYEKGSFGYDLQYLSEKDAQLVVLSSEEGEAQLIVSPKYQAKVFTSTVDGLAGKSLGYLNYKVLDSPVLLEQMNGYGGENRLWIGPEGGPYSIFFKPGVRQIYENWFTPKALDTEAWAAFSPSKRTVMIEKEMWVDNYIGSRFHLKLGRKIRLCEASEIKTLLGFTPHENVRTIAYATENSLTNLNDYAWTRETGALCIWMLDMFHPEPGSFTIVPYTRGDEQTLGAVATTDYFGPIPADRYKDNGKGLVFLKTDGRFRSKIGLNVKRSKAIAANYAPASGQLIVVTFDVDRNAPYLNQEWNPDKDPLIGDAFNAYNDGPLDDGSIMGPFLELESGSPAALLSPNESLYHNHNVFHFVGDDAALSPITEQLFGIPVKELKTVF